MKKSVRAADVEALIREIQRYLAYVEAFRARPPNPPVKPKEGKDD